MSSRRLFYRWKQSDIHVKREERKHKIAGLKAELEMNAVMLPRMNAYLASVQSEGTPFVERTVAQLRQSKETSKPLGSSGPSYDDMLLSLLLQVSEECKELTGEERAKKLAQVLERHRDDLIKADAEAKQKLAHEEAEQKKHITAEDIHEGFSSGVCLML